MSNGTENTNGQATEEQNDDLGSVLDQYFPTNGESEEAEDTARPDSPQQTQSDLSEDQLMGFDDPPEQPDTESEFGATSFDEGLEAGWKGLKAGAQYAAGEALKHTPGPTGEVASVGLQQLARESKQSAPENDDSWGYFLGSLVPSTVPSAAAIAAAPFTGGATLPMAASIGGLSFSSAGNGMMEYESYKQQKGQEVDPLAKLAVGVAYGGFEGAAERFSLGKLMPRGLGTDFFMKGNVEAAERVGRDMLQVFARDSPSRFRAITRQVRRGMGAEGLEEVATEIGQAATDVMYQEGDDRIETVKQLPANMFTAFMGGSIMGAALGPLSYGSQQKVHRDRRKQQGGVILAQNSADEQTYELIAPVQTEQQRGYQALDPEGNEMFIPEEQVGQVQKLTVPQFDKLLQDKLDTQQFELARREPVTVATYQGQEVEVKGQDGEGGFYITDPSSGEDINVDADQLENMQEIPPEEQMAAEGNPPTGQPNPPDEVPGQDAPGVLQNEEGDFVYPGDPQYEEILQQQEGIETDEQGVPTENEKRTLTLGTGDSKEQVVLASQEDDSFRVESRTTAQDGEPVVQEVGDMTAEEANELESNLQSHYDARYKNTDVGFEVQAVPSDPADPSSPMEIRVAPEGQQQTEGQQEEAAGGQLELTEQQEPQQDVPEYRVPNILLGGVSARVANDPDFEAERAEDARAEVESEFENASLLIDEMVDRGDDADRIIDRVIGGLGRQNSPLHMMNAKQKQAMRQFIRQKVDGNEQRSLQEALGPETSQEQETEIDQEQAQPEQQPAEQEEPSQPQEIEQPESQYQVRQTEEGIEVTDTEDGSVLDQNTAQRDEIVGEFIAREFTDSPTLEDAIRENPEIEQDAANKPVEDAVADYSENPVEIATEIERRKTQVGDLRQQDDDIIKTQFWDAGVRIPFSDFGKFSDENLADPYIKINTRNDGLSAEQISQSLDLNYDIQLSPEDVVLSFIEYYENIRGTGRQTFKDETLNRLSERFTEITGERYDDRLGEHILRNANLQELGDPQLNTELEEMADEFVDDQGNIAYNEEMANQSPAFRRWLFGEDIQEETDVEQQETQQRESSAEQAEQGLEGTPDDQAQEGAGQESPSQQRAERGRERINQILEGEEVPPLEDDPAFGEGEDQGTVEDQRRIYGDQKQYSGFQGPGGDRIGYLSVARENLFGDDPAAQGELQFGEAPEDAADDPALPDEFYTVKRGYRPDRRWNLTGRNSKIRYIGDVAYLMRALEDAATEHIFVVAVNEEGESVVQHISSGTDTASLVDPMAVQQLVNDFNPTDLYFVHNHPSGRLVPSDADRKQFGVIDEMTDGTVHGIIIDTYRGEYAVFNEGQASDEVLERPTNPGEDAPFDVQRFDRQIYGDPVETGTLASPEDIASFLTGARYSVGDKTVALLMNNAMEINGVFQLTDLSQEGITDQLIRLMPQHNSNRVILAGRDQQIDVDTINEINDDISFGGIADYVMVETSEGNLQNYQSMRAQGSVREPGSSFARQQLEQQLDQARREYRAAQRALENKRQELEETLEADQENLFGEREVDQENRLFDIPADPSQMPEALQPFQDRLEVARQQVNRIHKKLEQLPDDPDPSLFDDDTRFSRREDAQEEQTRQRQAPEQTETRASDLLDPSTSAHASRLANGLRQKIDGWAGQNRIAVAENPDQLPQDVRNLLELQQGRIGGLHHRGTAYIFTWNLSDAREADMTLMHEAIGHGGIRGLLAHMSTNRQDFQNRLKDLSNEIYESFKDTDSFQDIVDSYGLDMRRNDHRREAAEEYIAHLAETNPDATIVDKVVKFINDILRELGLSNRITNGDIKGMLADARQFMRQGTPTTVDSGGQLMRPAFKRSALADIFYGRMNNKIDADLNNKGTPQQFKQTLEAWNRKGEFKTEELEWSGLVDWLDGLEEGPVYRDDVMEFLEGNQIEIQERMLTQQGEEMSTDLGRRILDYMTEEVGATDEGLASRAILGETDAIDALAEQGVPAELLDPLRSEGTRYGEYTLPGGQNYRELLLTLPQRPQETMEFRAWFQQNYDQPVEEASGRLLAAARRDYDADLGGTTDAANFQSSHYDVPNVLAHVRFNERTDSEGNRILFLEEIQSDWHQTGRERGYRRDRVEELPEGYRIEETEDGFEFYNPEGVQIQSTFESREQILDYFNQQLVPDAPFKTTWHELVIKRMLRYGAQHGYDKVGWTTGQQQVDRFDLSKEVQRLEYYPDTERLFMVNHEGVEIPVEETISESDLRDAVGKELSERIIAQIDDGAEQVVIEGPDLETGGEGMKAFYNQMVPRFVSKYTKSWDADVAPIDITLDEGVYYEGPEATQEEIREVYESGELSDKERGDLNWVIRSMNDGLSFHDAMSDINRETGLAERFGGEFVQGLREKVLAVDITPDMRKDLLTNGQPLFVRLGNDFTRFEDGITSFLEGDIGEGTLLDGGNPSQILKDAGVPDRPLLVSQHVLKAGQHFELSDEALQSLPESLNSPEAVFSGRNPNGQILLVELDGEPALVKLDGTGQTNTIHDIWMGEGIAEKAGELAGRNLTRYVDPESSVAVDLGIAETETVRFRRMDPLEDTPHQFQKRRDRTMRLFLDRMVDVRRIQEGVQAEGGTLTDESNTYRAENRSSGKIETQQEDFRREYEDPLVDEANRLYQEENVTYDDINQYLKARHAPERNEYFLERNPDGGPAQSGMSDRRAAEIMAEMQDRGIAEDLEGLAEQADRMSDFVLDKWLESELISQQRYDALQERFDNYVPMRGFAEHMGVDPTVFAGDVSMEGRSSEAGDVLPYLTAMADTAIVAGEKNKVKQHLLNFVMDNWERSDLFEIKNVYYRATGQTNQETGKAEYEPTFVEPTTQELLEGTVKRRLDHDTETANWNSEASPFKEPESIRVQVEGRPVVIEFTTPHIAQALKKTNVSDMGWVTSQVARMTRFLRHVITQYSPEFGVRNLFRDSMTGYINLSIDFDTPTATAIVNPKTIGKGFAALRRGIRNGNFEGEWGEAFNEFREVGAMTGWWNLDQVRERARNLQRAIEDGGFTENPLQTSRDQFNAMLEWMDDYNRVMENIIRVSTYKHLTEEGVTNPDTGEAFTAKQAADYAKDLTVNFNRKGTESGIIGSWFIFFNAAVQGISRQAQPFFSDHSRRQWRAAAAPMIMSGIAFSFIEAMRYGLGQDDDGEYYYDKINEWTRTHNIMIPNLLSEEEDDFLKIPMAYGYNVYWAIGDMLSRAVYGSVSAGDAALELVATSVDAYNPIGTAEGETALETAGRTFTPTIGKPIVELLSNKDFAGRPIKPEPFPFEMEEPQSEQYFPWTPQYLQETAQFLNRISGGDEVTEGVLDFSPEHLEYIVDYLGGGAGKFVTGLVNSEENIRQHLTGQQELELYDIYDVPFARAHYGKVNEGVASDRFRERRDEIEKLVNRHEHYHDTDQTEKADRLYEANEELLRLETEAKAVGNQVSNLYDWMRALENQDQTEETQEKIDQIEQQIEDLYDGFNRKYNEIEGGSRQTVSELIFNGQ